jgi:hypothetical protein
MKYLRIFKAKKPIGQLSKSERREFASGLASGVLESLISVETRNLALGLKDITPESFDNTKEDFLEICDTRQTLKTVEQLTLDKSFEKLSLEYMKYLNSMEFIKDSDLLEVSIHYLTLTWIDDAVHKRSMDLYNRLLEIKSALIKLGSWTEELEAAYRKTSFGNTAVKPGTFVNCSVVIKQKDKFRLFDSAWDSDFWPAINSAAYKEATELGSVAIWRAVTNGMIPDLYLMFKEHSGWLKR